MQVKVKQLVWVQKDVRHFYAESCGVVWYTIIGIWTKPEVFQLRTRRGKDWPIEVFRTLDAAKDAAQADHEKLISAEVRDRFDTSGQPPSQKAARLSPGLYRMFWKSGGTSDVAVGMTSNGDNWIAPTNWIAPAMIYDIEATSWADVERLERVEPKPDF